MTSRELVEIAALTLRVGLAAVAIDALPAVALARLLARWEFRGKSIVRTLVALPMILPPVAIGLALLELLSRTSPVGRAFEAAFGRAPAFTWWAAALASAVVAFPLFVQGAERAFAAVPARLEFISRSLGLSRWQTFRRVSLPLAARGIAYGAVFAFARALGEFGATSMVAGRIPGETETLALAIHARFAMFRAGEAWTLAAVSLLLAFVPTLAAEMFLRRREP